jgi:hypothetical protein
MNAAASSDTTTRSATCSVTSWSVNGRWPVMQAGGGAGWACCNTAASSHGCTPGTPSSQPHRARQLESRPSRCPLPASPNASSSPLPQALGALAGR